MSLFQERPKEEMEEIYALAKFIGDHNMQKGSIDQRFLPYVSEVAAAIYDEGYRKSACPKSEVVPMRYINPIPYVDKGRKFEMRIACEFAEVIEVEEAKRQVAEWIRALPVEEIVKVLSCAKIQPVYPGEGSQYEPRKGTGG